MNRALTQYGAGQVMSLLTGGAPSMPAGTWMALSSTDFGEAGTGGTEPSQPSYARVPLTWTNAGTTINTQAPLNFPTLTEPWNPGSYVGGVYTPVRYAGVFDAASGGNCIMRFDVGAGGADLPAANVGDFIGFTGGFVASPTAGEVGDAIITFKPSFAASLLGHVLGAASYTVPALYLAIVDDTSVSNLMASYREAVDPVIFNYASGYARQGPVTGWGTAGVIGSGTYAGTTHADFVNSYTFGPLLASNPAFTFGLRASGLGLFDSATYNAGNWLARFLYAGVPHNTISDGDTITVPASLLWWWVD